MSTTTEPPTLGPADVADQVPPKKSRKSKPKTDRMLNPIANDLISQKSMLLSDGVKLCGHLQEGEPVTEDKILTLERLVRTDERFVVFIQDGKKHVGLAAPAEPVSDAQKAVQEQVIKLAQAPPVECNLTDIAIQLMSTPEDRLLPGTCDHETPTAEPAPATTDNVPTLGEMAAQVVADAAAAPVSETISKLPTAMERVQFELNCYMQRAAKVRALGTIYQSLKGQQSDLQAELTDIHKQLKDTAKKLADLAVERVDLTFQDPIPFAVAPEDATKVEDAGLKDEHGEPVTSEESEQAAPEAQQTIGLGDAPVDLTHLDNPGSGVGISAPPAETPETPATIPLDELAAASTADDLDAPPT